MARGFPADEVRCVGVSRQSGERCKRTGVPFTDPPRCVVHQGNNEGVRRKAEARMNAYAAGMLEPGDPPWLRRQKLKAWELSNQRWQIRKMKRAGVYDDWLRTQQQQQAEDKAAVARRKAERAKEREEWKARQQRVQTPAPTYDTGPGRAIPYAGVDPFAWDD